MMDKKLHQFFTQAKSVRMTSSERHTVRMALISLTPQEKAATKDRLQEFMSMHPVKKTKKHHGGFFHSLRHPFSLHGLPATAVIVALLVSSTGGLTYAAESTVPGDSLYSVKVGFTEPLREMIAFGDDRKAHVHLWRLERRFYEAERLLLQDDLDPELREMMEERIEMRSKHFEERLEHMKARRADRAEELENKYAVSLGFHESTFERLAERDGIHSEKMFEHVRGMRKRRFGEDFMPEKIDPEHLRAHIERATEHMERFGREHPERVETMRTHLNSAREALQSGNAEEAFRAMREARPKGPHHPPPFPPGPRGDMHRIERFR